MATAAIKAESQAPATGSQPEQPAADETMSEVDFEAQLDAATQTDDPQPVVKPDAEPEEVTPEPEPTEEPAEPSPEELLEQEADPDPDAEEGEPEQDDAVPEGVQKRIDKLTGKVKDVSRERDEAAKERDELKAKMEDAEKRASLNAPVDAAYLSDDEIAMVEKANSLDDRRRFLMDHMDGYEDESNPDNSITSTQVMAELKSMETSWLTAQTTARAAYDRAQNDMREHIALGKLVAQMGFKRGDDGKLVSVKAKAKPAPAAAKPKPAPVPRPSATASAQSETSPDDVVAKFEAAGGTQEAYERALEKL